MTRRDRERDAFPPHEPRPRSERMGIDRRSFIGGAVATLVLGAWSRPARAAGSDGLADALARSELVYVSPLKRDGSESACHGEVWFVTDGDDVLVVTAADRWRAEAIGRGLDQARLWVGEHGVWKRAGKAWEQSPTTDASARLEKEASVHTRALELFGAKYTREWGKWGPRFQQGLASGDRVLIRYTPKA